MTLRLAARPSSFVSWPGSIGFGPLVAALVVSGRFARSRVDWRPRLNREGVVNAAAFLPIAVREGREGRERGVDTDY